MVPCRVVIAFGTVNKSSEVLSFTRNLLNRTSFGAVCLVTFYKIYGLRVSVFFFLTSWE